MGRRLCASSTRCAGIGRAEACLWNHEGTLLHKLNMFSGFVNEGFLKWSGAKVVICDDTTGEPLREVALPDAKLAALKRPRTSWPWS